MTVQDENKQLVIDLDTAQHATALSEGALLHQEDLLIFERHVQAILQHIPAFKHQLENPLDPPSISYDRYHDVITIHGKRGSGKTTLLLSALDKLRKQDPSRNQLGNLCVLEIMDPTLFGLHDHLLHSLLGKIVQKVRKHVERQEVSLIDDGYNQSRLDKWERSLWSLAKGLKYAGETRDDLRGPMPAETVDWMDAEFLMEKGMDTACHGVDLERAFHSFLNDSLTILGKSAFVLGLDDIDTRPSIGWHVLEVLRRYFTTPQLIVVIAGDIDLFKTLIEKQQLSIFGLDFTTRKSVLDEFQSRIDTLTEQYLLKILHTSNRIGLGYFQTALNHLKAKGTPIFIKFAPDNNLGQNSSQLPLEDFLEKYFNPLFAYPNMPEQHFFKRTLFANPVRSVVQALYGLTKGHEQAIDDLDNVFFIPLQRIGFLQADTLTEIINTPAGINFIMRQLFTHGFVEQGIDLLPLSADGEKNNAILALHAGLTYGLSKNITVLFAYLFKACILREILYAELSDISDRSYFSIETYLQNDTSESMYKILELMSILYLGDVNINQFIKYHGILRLYKSLTSSNKLEIFGRIYPEVVDNPELPHQIIDEKLKELYPELYGFYSVVTKGKISHGVSILFNTPENLAHAIRSWQKNIINLGIIDVQGENQNFRIFSILPLIGIVADFLENQQEIISFLAEPKKIPTYPIYREKNIISEREELTSEEVPIDNIYNTGSSEKFNLFFNLLLEWSHTSTNRDIQILSSPLLCSRIIKRFFSSVERINTEVSNINIFLGMYIHRCLVAFFNSVLIEESLLTFRGSIEEPIAMNNAITQDKNFVNNFLLVSHLSQNSSPIGTKEFFRTRLPLFTFILSCPLWGLYLKNDEEDKGQKMNDAYSVFMEFQGDNKNILEDTYIVTYGPEQKTFSNLYYPLNTVAIQKRPPKK